MSSSSPPALGLGSWPAAQRLPPPRRPLVLSSCARASRPYCELARGAGARPRLVAAESPPPAPLPAVRRDAETGLALLLVVHAMVMSFFLSLTIIWFSAHRALHKLETAVNNLAKVFAEEVPGTLSSLKLSLLEISDLTSQLKNLRNRFTMSRFGKKGGSKASSR